MKKEGTAVRHIFEVQSSTGSKTVSMCAQLVRVTTIKCSIAAGEGKKKDWLQTYTEHGYHL